MAKKNITYVDAALIEGLLIEMGLKYDRQKGFVKVELGPKGRRVYIGNTASVGRVDISGFECPADWIGIKRLGGESFGNVKEQLDFETTEGVTPEVLVARLRCVMEYGASLGDREEKRGGKESSASPAPKPKGWMTEAEKAAQLALLKHVAEQHGTTVSPKAEQELAASA